ncbi:unnamed protein product [Linum tenue]|uniref:Uncharacterized protein n=1 Tax=Linum tenue TaxID=586396 RepID=A0AAV0KW55_9ROSI|nr:unnamed protein product [Linum tenue]
MVYRYPNRATGSLWHEEYTITTQDDVDSMLEFLRSNKLAKAEMFVYTEPAVGRGGHSGHGQTSVPRWRARCWSSSIFLVI